MTDETQNALQPPAAATESGSVTPQNITKSPSKTASPPTATEKFDNTSGNRPSQPTSLSSATQAGTPTPPEAVSAPAPVKLEPAQPPVPAPVQAPVPAPAATSVNKPLSISIPPSTNGTAISPSTNVAAPPSSGTPAPNFSTLRHIFSNPINSIDTPAISPLSDVGYSAKRSRTPEPQEQNGGEKKQKLDHTTEDMDQSMLEVGAQVENENLENSIPEWDLEAQIRNILDSIPPPADDGADGAAGYDRHGLPESILPPPRARLEKMKYIENPTYFARAMGLPTLGSLSVQILLALFQQPSEVTDRQIRDVRTEGGKVYTALRGTFMALLKLFIDTPTFLVADDLDINDPGDRETVQMANLASMCASFYGPGGPTMATAHDNFLKIMIPENGIITQEIAALYLDQKTQSFLAYANVMEDKEATRNSLMEKFFPGDLEDKLRAYWKDSNLPDFLPSDEFVKAFTDRRKLLKAVGHDKEQRKALETKYQFASFLDNLSAFIRSNFDSILDYAESHGVEVPNEAGEEDLMLMHAQATYSGSYPGQPRRNGQPDTDGLAILISERFAGEDGYAYGYGSASAIPESKHLPPSQSLPTSVLYERARQAAVAKSSAGARREGLQSTRRPWTPEEEKALMAGLDMVKGPHWSQILQLFGPNGTIKDILKDRTQVQLKDKARNLKLFFLKTNSEMPYYLQCVTGELKTRAPSQAAKKEAEEQARVHAGGHSNGYAYTNGSANGTGPAAHGQPIAAASPRPGTTPPVAGHPTPAGMNPSHPHPQQYQQPHQPQQHQQQSYQQPRPQQLQPAPNGAARSPAPAGYHHPPLPPPSAKPSTPHSSHQPIAPAPSYQRPLQQAGAPPAPQFQQRPKDWPASKVAERQGGDPPATSRIQQPANRPAAPSPSNGHAWPARPNSTSTTPQVQSRPPAPVAQGPSAAQRPVPTANTALPPRPAFKPAASATPSPAPGQANKGVPPHNMPVSRSHTPGSVAGASASPKPVQQPTVPTAGAQVPARPAQQPPASMTTAPAPPAPPGAKPAMHPSAKPSAPTPPTTTTATPAAALSAPAPTRSLEQPAKPTLQPVVTKQTPVNPIAPTSSASPAPVSAHPAPKSTILAPAPVSAHLAPKATTPAPPPVSAHLAPKAATPAPPPVSAHLAPKAATPTPAPVSAHLAPKATTHAPVPDMPANTPDRVEANVEMLAQSLREETT